jgi:hypothetical protein
MTDKNIEQEETLAGGLPELEESASKEKPKGSKKKPPIGFVVGLVALLGVSGFGIQYAINHLGIFEKEPQVVDEPPVPVVSNDVMDSPSGNDFLVNDPLLSGSSMVARNDADNTGTQALDIEANIPPEQLKGINDSLVMLAEVVGSIAGQLNKQQDSLIKVMQSQNALLKQFEMEVARREASEETLTNNVKENQRWLGGISNQLKEIGVDVKEASQEFPIVVYSKNVWGDDVFLTVAQKVAPDQTSFLRIGGIVGRWRLVEIFEHKALFEHFEGNRKEVML